MLFSGSPNSTATRGLKQGSQPPKSVPTLLPGIYFLGKFLKVVERLGKSGLQGAADHS
jgi:hypothetical protein